ncbi:LysR family transcriptional regulator (plasmid) [Lichenicola cladoniae]|uniref:LysR family transcriptional regulator n=1 Tax=Lichenicola cladoniae TaxID=1484109 RepID=A0A6M8HXR0_9PROT|nr:LysR family transcriptional regulator [Lichenicola cladoniae]NPD67811.1 LysR family transcriptional regulator [Acetobacteraceae bacterium]QKE93344.1 LysR family transcriptional regulator [Lichenicola cladoniae]
MQPDTVSLSQLRCFIAVIDAQSFVSAARQLALTTSGVSKTISRLEAGYGLRLLHRSTHSISPTDAGEQLIGPARAVLNGAADIDAILTHASMSAATGSVRIGAPPAFIRRRLVPLLPAFIERHPDIVLDLRASDVFVDLAEVGLDLAIRSGPLHGLPGHVRLPWFEFDWVACGSPSYLGRRGMPVTPSDLTRHDLIGFRNTRTGLIEPWRLRAESFPRSPNWRFITDDAESALLTTMEGAGIMWGPRWLAADALASGMAIEVLPDWRGNRMPMSILRRGQNLLPNRVRAVMDFLFSQAAALAKPNGPLEQHSPATL